MRVVMFYHSLLSDWNHGNAHFLRGIVREFKRSGHSIDVWEPAESWSLRNLVADHGEKPIRDVSDAYPGLSSNFYTSETLDLEQALSRADLVLVHEWNDPSLIAQIGRRHI